MWVSPEATGARQTWRAEGSVGVDEGGVALGNRKEGVGGPRRHRNRTSSFRGQIARRTILIGVRNCVSPRRRSLCSRSTSCVSLCN